MGFDTKFRPEFVPRRYRDIVAREAVMQPILKMDRRQRLTDEKLIQATHKLTTMWRARVLELRDHGWHPAQGSSGPSTKPIDYMRNCRPNFVSMMPRTRTCKMWHACPFCWGRMVQQVYDKVDNAFPDTTLVEPREVVPATVHEGILPEGLAVGERKRRALVLEEDVTTAADGKKRNITPLDSRVFPYHLVTVCKRSTYSANDASLPNLVDGFCSSRARIRAIPFVGAMISTTIVYQTKQWRLAHRYLLMVEDSVELPRTFEDAPGFKRNEQPTRRAVMNAVALTCQYPRQILVGDPKYSTRILHATRGRRLRALYGCFRKSSNYGSVQ